MFSSETPGFSVHFNVPSLDELGGADLVEEAVEAAALPARRARDEAREVPDVRGVVVVVVAVVGRADELGEARLVGVALVAVVALGRGLGRVLDAVRDGLGLALLALARHLLALVHLLVALLRGPLRGWAERPGGCEQSAGSPPWHGLAGSKR